MAQDNKYVDMRLMLKRMRDADKGIEATPKAVVTEASKDMSVREMKKRLREFTELQEELGSALTPDEQRDEEDKLRNAFTNNNVALEFAPIEVHDVEGEKRLLLTGTIDGQIMFSYSVAPEENKSGVDIQYLEGFNPNDTENQEIIETLKRYYNDFYRYWRDRLYA